MTKNQLTERLAIIDAELRRGRAKLDRELWDGRQTDLDYARTQIRLAKLSSTPSIVWDCLGRACDAIERVLATDEATESDGAWTVEEILRQEG